IEEKRCKTHDLHLRPTGLGPRADHRNDEDAAAPGLVILPRAGGSMLILLNAVLDRPRRRARHVARFGVDQVTDAEHPLIPSLDVILKDAGAAFGAQLEGAEVPLLGHAGAHFEGVLLTVDKLLLRYGKGYRAPNGLHRADSSLRLGLHLGRM